MRERLPGYFRYLSSSFSRSFIVLAFLAPRRRNSSDREEEEALNNNNNNNREVNHYLTPITPNKNGRAQVAFIGRILKWRAQEIRGVDDKTRLSTFEIKRRRKRSSNCVSLSTMSASPFRMGPLGSAVWWTNRLSWSRYRASRFRQFLSLCVHVHHRYTHTHTPIQSSRV